MKHLITLLFLLATVAAFSQSNSFLTLKEKFHGDREVTSLSVGGFLLKTALLFSGEDDFRDEFGNVRNVRLINIPQEAFEDRHLKLSGFKKVLRRDNFEEVVRSREGNEEVTVYIQEHGSDSNLYFILVEEASEVTAIEIKGKIDPKIIVQNHSKQKFITYN
jgi:hypothetical protein